jgi:outer membrane autotransporter protein
MTAEPMKTKHIKITNRTARQLRCILAAFITGLLPVLVLILTIESSFAQSGTWVGEFNGDWNFVEISTGETNWTGNVVPNGPADTATFESSNTTAVSLSANTEVNGIVFNPGASAFTITVNPVSLSPTTLTLTISGAGITNNSGITQNFVTAGGLGAIVFTNSATAGNVTITNSGGTVTGGVGGATVFLNTSTAGSATIRNNGGTGVRAFGGVTVFGGIADVMGRLIPSVVDTSSAGSATIINNGGTGGGFGGTTEFLARTDGGTARAITNGNGNFDISRLTTPGTKIGSIEGSGNYYLGSKTLIVGGNNLSTTVSGVIQDGGFLPGFFGDSGTGGSLTKVGTGTLTLTGANTYTGPTTVNDGSLIVDRSVASALTLVNPGGLLGGLGSLGGNLVNSGIVSPGDPVGTLTVKGNYTQTTGGTLRIEVAGLGPSEHDLLMVHGTANLAGTLQVIRLNNFQLRPGDQITFLTASEVNGTFGTVQNDFSTTGTIVGSRIVYNSDSVVLEGTQGSFATVCPNPNDVAVGTALNSAVGDPRAAGLIEFLDTEPLSELCSDLDLISPEELASIFNIGVSLANIQTANLERRMDDIRKGSRGFSASGFVIDGSTPNFSGSLAGPTGPEGKSGPSVMQSTPENRWGVFVTGLGEFTNVGDTSNAHGYDLTTGGLTLGVDYRVSPNFAIGLTGGYAHTNAELVDNGNLEVDGGKIGLYATAFGGGFYVDGAVIGGFNDYDTDRTALLGTARGSTDGAEFTALVASGYDWKIGGLSIGPVANFQYTYVDFDGFTESGSLAPLKFNSQNADSIRTSVGLKTSYDWKVGSVVVRPEFRGAWQHEFGDSEYSIVSRFANGAGSSFTVNGPKIGRDSLLIGAGAAVLLSDRISIYAYYDGELARTNYVSNNVSAGLRVTF